MSHSGHLSTPAGNAARNPVRSSVALRSSAHSARRCDDFGYGLGPPTGILVLRYAAGATLEFGDCREDYLHQLYWAPRGVLWAESAGRSHFLGPGSAWWAQRAVAHRVRFADAPVVYRVCVREVPEGVAAAPATAVSISPAATEAIVAIARPGCSEDDGLRARKVIMDGLVAWSAEPRESHGAGYAIAVARALAQDPADDSTLDDWAARFHVAAKTLQRDFGREFGMSFSRWRQHARLEASRALLAGHSVGEVARLVGYANASAYVAAFGRRYGHSPGSRHSRTNV